MGTFYQQTAGIYACSNDQPTYVEVLYVTMPL